MQIISYLTNLFKATFVVSESDKKESEFRIRFSECFFKEKYFLHSDSSEQKLAFILNVSEAYLSNYISSNFNMDFFALCNKNRIEHFQEAMEDPKNSEIPISSLIMGSGFDSVESFKASLQSDKSDFKAWN